MRAPRVNGSSFVTVAGSGRGGTKTQRATVTINAISLNCLDIYISKVHFTVWMMHLNIYK